MSDWISEKACAKINLALHVLGRRADGYHELDSIVGFADFGDEIRIRESVTTSLAISGPFADAVPTTDNIIWKVLAVVKSLGIALPQLEIQLDKNLPVSSGIGGGSADAAAVLRAVLRLTNGSLSADDIMNLAQSLGADVPVCFSQRSARMQGIGEIIRPLTISLPRAIVLINPLEPCTTKDVFQKLNLAKGQQFGSAVDVDNPMLWRNDLTDAALAVEPAIARILAALKSEPCFSAVRMSGSGATCFGLMSYMAEASSAAARLAVKNPKWWVKAAELV